MKIKAWLYQKTPREQLVLLAGMSVILLYFIWLLLWQPMLQARELSAVRVANAEQSLFSVRSLAQDLVNVRMTSEARSMTAAGSLAQTLDELASALGLRIASLEPAADNSSVLVRLNDVSMPTLLAWLFDIESSGAMSIDSLAVSPSRTSGEVAVSLRLRSN